jgi:hypothetical protein
MASERQIQANRRNAQKSTGPRTEQGKAISRLNALTHGLSARTVAPVLPHEDPRALDERTRRWISDWQPRNDMELELVAHAAQLSWKIDRAERFETAHLSKRVRRAQRRAAGEPDPKRLQEVADLGGRLLCYSGNGSRNVLLARLEASAEGCRWLQARWVEVQSLVSQGPTGEAADLHRFLNLLGQEHIEAVTDPALNALILAWDVLKPGTAAEFWKQTRDDRTHDVPSYARGTKWRELVPRPADPAEASQLLAATMEQQIDRLTRLLAEHAALAAEESAELADRAAFDPGRGFERHRRHRSALGRELHRTLETLRKLRKDEAQIEAMQPDSVSDDEQVDTTEISPQTEVAPDTLGNSPEEDALLEKTPKEANLRSMQLVCGQNVMSRSNEVASTNRTHLARSRSDGKNAVIWPDLAENHRSSPGAGCSVVRALAEQD